MQAVVQKQAILLGLGMGAGIVSAILGSLVQWAFHVSGLWVSTVLWGAAMLLIIKCRPDALK